MNTTSGKTVYREFLWPSVNTIGALLIVWPTMWLTVYPWDQQAGIWIGALLTALLLVLAFARSKTITLTSESLTLGEVKLPLAEISGAVALLGEEARVARGPGLSPNAYVVFRGTTQKLVRIQIQSEQDPTPYWLISSRKPEALASAINELI